MDQIILNSNELELAAEKGWGKSGTGMFRVKAGCGMETVTGEFFTRRSWKQRGTTERL